MRLSKRSEYACLAIVDLARRDEQGYAKAQDISQRNDMPKKYLDQILLQLKRAGYVRSARGAEGGYKLAKQPTSITLAEVIRLMDGALAPVESVSKYFYEETPIAKQPKLHKVLREIRDFVAHKMETTTFADLI